MQPYLTLNDFDIDQTIKIKHTVVSIYDSIQYSKQSEHAHTMWTLIDIQVRTITNATFLNTSTALRS